MATSSYRDSTQPLDDVEAEVIGALTASETFLQQARDDAYAMPEFKVSSYNYVLNRPTQVTIDYDHDQKPDGVANISYTIFRNLRDIQIDRDNDGTVDSKFVNRRNIFGWSRGMDYDRNNDGKNDIFADLWWSGFPWRRIRNLQYSDADTGSRLANTHLSYGLLGISKFTIDRNLDGKTDYSGDVQRGLYRPMNRFGSFR